MIDANAETSIQGATPYGGQWSDMETASSSRWSDLTLADDLPVVLPREVTVLRDLPRAYTRCELARLSAVESLNDYPEEAADIVDEFIRTCLDVRDAIVWEDGLGQPLRYDWWPAYRRDRLLSFFDDLVSERLPLDINCPNLLNNMANPHHDRAEKVYYAAAEAFDVYVAHVAHVLFLELTEAVPWSVLSYSDAEREELLASRRYFAPIEMSLNVENGKYPDHIAPQRDFQLPYRTVNAPEAVICDPTDGYRFVTGSVDAQLPTLLGDSADTTLAGLSAWLRDNAGHGDGFSSRTEMANMAFLRDRLKQDPMSGDVRAAHGCHSAANLLYDLAKSVNIPLLVVKSQDDDALDAHYSNRTHSGLVYRWDSDDPRVLLHADDLYANELGPAFPLAPRYNPADPPQPLHEPAVDWAFFEATRVRWEDLEAWHFEGFEDLPIVQPGEGFGVNSGGNYEEYDEYDEFAGYWPTLFNNDGEMLDAHTRFKWEQNYEICGWLMVGLFCESPGFFYNQIVSILGPRDDESPLNRPADDFVFRAMDCVAAHGGCEQILENYDEWSEARGAHSWPLE